MREAETLRRDAAAGSDAEPSAALRKGARVVRVPLHSARRRCASAPGRVPEQGLIGLVGLGVFEGREQLAEREGPVGRGSSPYRRALEP